MEATSGSLPPLFILALVSRQLSEEETNKCERRQAGRGDMPPHENTCPVDLFLGTTLS